MLRTLHVHNFVLIEDATLELDAGFNVITGETGAGKSLLVDALSALLGARAQKEWVRKESEAAVIEAVFDISRNPRAQAWLAALSLPEGDGELIVRRSIAADGKGRVTLQSRPSSVSELAQVMALLIQLCGQHSQSALLDDDYARTTLDLFGGLEAAVSTFNTHFAQYQSVQRKLSALLQENQHKNTRLLSLREDIRALQMAHIEPGEEEKLRALKRRLAQREKILTHLGAAAAAIENEESGALQTLSLVGRSLRELSKLDDNYDALGEPLTEAEEACDRLLSQLQSALQHFETEEMSVDDVETRLHLITRLTRQHAVMADDLSALLGTLQETLAELEASEVDETQLKAEREALEKRLLTAGKALSAARQAAAQSLADDMTARLQTLAMHHARFFVRVVSGTTLQEAHASGFDTVTFEMAANDGEGVGLLSKVASGGELSRVTLALQSILGERSQMPVYVFDEVDAGIGGGVGETVAQTLKRLCLHAQVLCVTHLPQIAAYADCHFNMRKETNLGRTYSQLTRLAGPAREQALAQMLGGLHLSESVKSHARELLTRSLVIDSPDSAHDSLQAYHEENS